MRYMLFALASKFFLFSGTCQSQDMLADKQPVPRVSIRVVDKETLQPIDARILILNQHADQLITPLFEDKSYKYKLTLVDTVNISVYAKGYQTLNKSLAIADLNGIETYYLTADSTLSFQTEPIGRSILKEDINSVIYFSQSNTQISPRSVRHLERLKDYIQKNRVSLISLQGHTDNVGDADKNMKLSMDRNSVVRAYLMQSASVDGSIKSKSFGATKPAAPNDCEQNKRFNRRVEVQLSAAYK